MNSIIAIIISIALIIINVITDLMQRSRPMFGGDIVRRGGKIPDNLLPIYEKSVKLRHQPPIITINDIAGSMKYIPRFETKPGIHIGQRKLFLTEIQYLTNMLTTIDPAKGMEYVLYAGAAPSVHTNYLSQLFPNVQLVLIDPAKFDINVDGQSNFISKPDHIVYLKGSHGSKSIDVPKSDWPKYVKENPNIKIFIIEDYMTDEYSTLFAPLQPHFISDVRSEIHRTGVYAPHDLDVVWNMAMQYVWITLMNPKSFMLKFRTPYYDVKTLEPTDIEKDVFKNAKDIGIDFVADFAIKKFKYFDGTVYIQAWPGKSSSETRLVAKAPFKFKTYDPVEFEDKLFYYNVVDRGFVHHANAFANKEIGFDHCNDCALEAVLWAAYRDKLVPSFMIIEAIKRLSFIVKRNLFIGVHGYLFDPNPNITYIKDTFAKLERDHDAQHRRH